MRDWRGLAVLVLALAVGVCLVVAFVAAAQADQPVGQWAVNILFATLGGVIGVVATYVRRGPE